ncbi:IQ domain-containing protein IQM6 isoform X1 [Cucumis sativus]|uniref:IQ domain-containing protein IQM6 isoform X1 n=1 Tax=Cucumis sativus TaxID=3659 RepID=UPI0005EC410A|nr:IQ domain-containing protein IQM6 isoform X1 [Cucumis sativus]XP_011652063.1 IQ domain-containing protein IQM6 isoform X1 [Cucumis sativus]XP_011652064.1 IQ domain-containing protein IQM6 isoform X1 [Cucumis sativus]XP_031738744.1 IQ domain-containing protein IQM6 isoform X1 [Cucumis sativus]
MGQLFSCPLGDFEDLDFDAVLVRSISFQDGEMRNPLRSVSFNGRDSEPTILKSFGSHRIRLERPITTRTRELETVNSFKTPCAEMENSEFGISVGSKNCDQCRHEHFSSPHKYSTPRYSEPRHQHYSAALRLQKVYKSFRTRRQLADCAVLVEQRWFVSKFVCTLFKILNMFMSIYPFKSRSGKDLEFSFPKSSLNRWKLLDFAELKRSSISFFDIEKPETAISRWSRARTRAAKVGKGLSKDEKARKLALQHWLEAIDPRHRYGHNLQFYYVKWLHCDSKQPFFYWLDIGEGKEVNLERCPRYKLHQQCIKYLGPIERKAYEVVVENGKFLYRYSGKLLHTTGGPRDAKWIFVLSTSKTLYVGLKKKGTFQHSSFLAGGATLAAGRLVVEDGILKAVWPHSGHYLPTEENFLEFMSFLMENNVDLTDVEKSPYEEEERLSKDKFTSLQEDSEDHIGEIDTIDTIDENNPSSLLSSHAETPNQRISRLSRGLRSKITNLQIPERSNVFDIFKKETLPASCRVLIPDSPSDDGYETAEELFLSEEEFMVPKSNLFDEDEEENDEQPIPKENILRRIVSHKEMKSYQLAKQLSSRWTTGAGPRIGCMRDYPQELQNKVLEQAHLSPRGRVVHASHSRTQSRIGSMASTPCSCKDTSTARSPLASKCLVLPQTPTPPAECN